MAGELIISYGWAHHIIHKVLQHRKVFTTWVSKAIHPRFKKKNVCEIFLYDVLKLKEMGFHGDSHWWRMLGTLVLARDKLASREWWFSSSLKPKIVQTTPSGEGGFMFSTFWDCKGPIGILSAKKNYYQQRGVLDLLENHWKPAIRLFSVLASCYTCSSSTRLCVWNVFHILHDHPTSHHMNIVYLYFRKNALNEKMFSRD